MRVQVTASGPGLQAEGVALNAMTEFTVDASKAGQVAPLDIVLVDADSNTLDVKVTDNKNATYTCKYTPLKANLHTVCIAYGGVAIPSSPFKVLSLLLHLTLTLALTLANLHTVCVANGGVAIPSSPFKVLFLPATRYFTVESVITLSSSGNCPFAKSYYSDVFLKMEVGVRKGA